MLLELKRAREGTDYERNVRMLYNSLKIFYYYGWRFSLLID